MTDVALVVVHAIVLNCPAVMVVGEAVRAAVVCGGGGGGGGPCVDEPPPLHAVTAIASTKRPVSPTIKCASLPTKTFPPNTAEFEGFSKIRVAPEFPLARNDESPRQTTRTTLTSIHKNFGKSVVQIFRQRENGIAAISSDDRKPPRRPILAGWGGGDPMHRSD